MKKVRRIVSVLVICLAVCLMTGCGKGDDLNEQGLTYYQNGEYESAAAAFNDAIAADNTKAEYYRNRAMALIKLEKYDQAATCLNYAEQLEPNTLEIERAKGVLYFEQGKYEAALVSFEKALSLTSGAVSEVEYDLLYYIADCEMRLEQYADAANIYTRLLNAGNTSLDIYYLRGVAYLKSGKIADAGMDFNRVAEAGSYEEYWKIYTVLKEAGETELAEQYLSQGVLISGNMDSDHKWRAEFHYYLGNYEEALAEFDLVAQEALDVDSYMMMAQIYRSKGDMIRVKAAFSIIETKKPNDPYLTYQQTLFWMDAEEYETAYDCAVKGMELSDNEYLQAMHYCKAVSLEYLGRYKEALTAFLEYRDAYGSTDEIEHEIAFLNTRVN